jgi:predicted DNA repair protein MutK
VLDDVAILTKVAAKKTAGVLGDDLALNAEQVSGVRAERELPVVWAVAKGSFINKLILVPSAIAISALAPWAIIPLLMIGGVYLCFEGVEKLAHKFLHSKTDEQAAHTQMIQALARSAMDLVAFEKEKIKGAIRTDFILSAEIIVIALDTVKDAALGTQIAVVAGIAALMTIGVYGLVAGIVKLDDAGQHLVKSSSVGGIRHAIGQGLLRTAPYLMKTLSVVGTFAMFIVGGGILVHGIPGSPDWLHHAEQSIHQIPGVGAALAALTPTVLNTLAGVVTGALALVIVSGIKAMLRKS